MPGPGGGSRGGGFGGGSRGGFGGGGMGRGPGGFGGGFGRGPYRPRGHFFGPMFWGYRHPYYYGGGCLGGLVGMLVAPIILIMIVVMTFISMFGSTVAIISNGGEVRYNEADFQDYANEQYINEFGSSSAYEDNLLIIFLTNEEADGYYTIAWIGDNINTRINEMFGNQYSEFGRAMQSSVNSGYYAYSLSSNLAMVMEKMTDEVTELGLKSSFKSPSDHSKMTESHLTNRSDLSLNEQTVNSSLKSFTEATDIPVVIVVDSMETVFGKTITVGDILTIVILIGFLAFAIWLIVRAVRSRKNNGGQNGTQNGNQNGNQNGSQGYNSYNDSNNTW